MAIKHKEVKIRAAIRMGGEEGFYLETPYIKSLNVKRTRGQMSATFSATLKVKHSQLELNKTNMVGNKFEIWAGTINNEQSIVQENKLPEIFDENGSRYILSLENDAAANIRKVFTGYVLKMNFNPCREDAEFVYLSVSGNDIFYILQDKKFTRRAKPSQLEMWGAITSVVRSRANFDTKFPEKLEENKPTTKKDSVFFKGQVIKTKPMKDIGISTDGDAGGLTAGVIDSTTTGGSDV